jgi:hypothetical protein
MSELGKSDTSRQPEQHGLQATRATLAWDSATGSRNRRYLRLAIGLPVMGLVWYFVIRSLSDAFRQIEWSSVRLDVRWLAAAVVALLLARLMNGVNCALMLRALGQHVRVGQVAPIIWIASLGRYVPGKMAVVAGATYMLVNLGIRMPIVLASLFLSTSLMILMGLATSTPFLLTPLMREKLPWGWAVSLGVLIVAVVCLHPRVFTGLCNLALKRFRQPSLPSRLASRPLLGGIAVTGLRNLLLGAGLWLAMRSLGPVSAGGYPLALGSTGVASVAGFLAIYSPGGLGVHEAVYLLTLQPLLGQKVALLLVIFRLLHILADALAGGAGTLLRAGVAPAALSTVQEGT